MNRRTKRKLEKLFGTLAAIMAIIFSFSNIDQIRLNLSGHPGSILVPSALFLNCILWVTYSMFKEKKDWWIIIANVPCAILGAMSAITAL